MSYQTISIIGLGYIGLPTAAVFASRKKNVIGVDVNRNAVDTINRGEIHIIEPNLEEMVRSTVSGGFLRATTEPEPADAFLIAVPTPFKDGYQPDLSFIESAVTSIAPVLKPGDLVILESTSPVGTTEQMAGWLASARPDLSFPQTHGETSDIRIAHCPERVLPGYVLRELVQNDRVIGGMTPKCSEAAATLYKTFVNGACVLTNARTAEMCKLTENSFRDVNIAFANELSIICDKLGIDVWSLIALANRHPRVDILRPGPGVGGHCIAVDPWFIVSAAGTDAKLIRSAREVNDRKPTWVLDKVEEAIQRSLVHDPKLKRSDITVACLGLTFKPNIDDIRESPALKIAKAIKTDLQIRVVAVEPNLARKDVDGIDNIPLSKALTSADILLGLVGHREFGAMADALCAHQNFIDTCGIINTR